MKAVNRGLANEFHVWQRSGALPACVMCDLDAWALVAADMQTSAPIALYELKRSYLRPDEWRPFAADRPNYASLQALAVRAGIPFYGVYWQKGRPIDAETPLRVWAFAQVVPEYRVEAEVMSAATFASRFPYPLWIA